MAVAQASDTIEVVAPFNFYHQVPALLCWVSVYRGVVCLSQFQGDLPVSSHLADCRGLSALCITLQDLLSNHNDNLPLSGILYSFALLLRYPLPLWTYRELARIFPTIKGLSLSALALWDSPLIIYGSQSRTSSGSAKRRP